MMAMQYIHEMFDLRAKADPEAVFLETLDGDITYRELTQKIEQLETELRQNQVRVGDRVLIVAENCTEHIALIMAISRVGAWSCGVNARMSKGEIAGFIKKADPRLIYFTTAVSAEANQHANDYQAQSSILTNLKKTSLYEQAIPEEGDLAKKVAAIIFTSGTTGGAKGVLVSHAGLIQFGKVSSSSRGLTPKDKSYAYLPMTHIFGLGTVLSASLYAGAKLVMRNVFDPKDVFNCLATGGLTNLQGPPTMFVRLLSWLEDKGITNPACPDLRYVYTGAAPLDMNLKQKVEKTFGHPLHHGYGLSEYAGAVCLVKTGVKRNDTSAGYAVEGGEVRVVNEKGEDLPSGEKGEIWMRGIGLMPGYFRDPEATSKVFKPGGWYASGDVGYIDTDGALFVVGRLKEMIIRSGFNVYPGELEAVINSYPGVEKSAVVGKKESDGNEAVLAFVEPKANAKIQEDSLRAYMVENLAPYKRPSKIIFVDKFPMTHSGKIIKRLLVD